MRKPANLELTMISSMFICNIMNERYENKFEVNPNIEIGSFDLDMNDEEYDGGSYSVDNDGTIRIVSLGNIPLGDEVIGNGKEKDKEFTNRAYDKLDKING